MTDTLAPLLVKWLTHDFATPIATVMTASELLGDVADAEINGLVSDAARRLGARLRLVRAALAPGDSPIGGAALETLIRAGIEGTALSWDRSNDESTSATDGRYAAIIAGAAMLLADVRRGQALTVTATGVRYATPAALPDAVAAALAGGPATDSRSAVAAMLAAAADRAELVLTVTADGITWG
jgi:hypothetical protein